ncbi:MAG: septum formation initiator family protein, partial [Bacteroidales bacterium]|nr:septum formation initiator family protein [Bacteroidales bacterium]
MHRKSFKNSLLESILFRIIKNKYFLLSIFFIIWVLFIDTNNLIRWYSDMKDVAAQERQKRYYKEAIRQTDEQLKELRSNLDSLEKFAREQYYFHRADEELFIVEDSYYAK